MRTAWLLLLAALVPVCTAQGPAGPVAYWAFEEDAVDRAVDVTGGGHDVVLHGVERVPGAIGRALRFSGNGSQAQAPLTEDLQSPAAVTLEAWVRPDAVPPGSEGLGILDLGNVLLRLTRGTPSFHVFTDRWGPVLADGAVRPGQWYHVAGSYDGRTMRVYVNGELAGECERAGPIPRCDRPLRLGRQANPLIGLVDEAKVYTRCLPAAAVAEAFSAAVATLNPGVEPGTLRYPGESWMSAEWHPPELPPPLRDLADARGPQPAARGAGNAMSAVRVDLPKPLGRLSGGRPVDDLAWRFAERLGCAWMQLWPPAGPSEDWETLARLLTARPDSGVKLAVPLPVYPKAMRSSWERLAPHAGAIGAVLVGNGLPTNPWEPLASWRATGALADWLAACDLARSLVPAGTRVFLARVPLIEPGAPERVGALAAALAGHADGLCLAVHGVAAPEAIAAGPLRQASTVARGHGLEVWLDAAADPAQPVALRTALMLRLLALCHAQGIRLTWWSAAVVPSALPAATPDATPLLAALQAWNGAVEPPPDPVEVASSAPYILRWQGPSGRRYVAWWRADDAIDVVDQLDLDLPEGAAVLDPLHGRWLKPRPDRRVPLCPWPLIARSGGG